MAKVDLGQVVGADGKDALIDETVTGKIASFSDGCAGMPMKSIVAEITPVQSGSGDPSPTNIRPISGRTGLTVTRAGKNLAKFANEILNADRTQNGITFHALNESTVRISGTATGNVYLTYPQSYEQLVSENHFYRAGTYTMSSNLLRNTSNYAYLIGFEFEIDGTPISKSFATNVYDGHPVTFTREADFYANIQMSIQSGSDFSTGIDTWVQIEPDSTATAYEPYTGASYPVSWQTEAGTVYGGTLDVVSGVLTVDKVLTTFDGTGVTWTKYTPTSGNYCFRTTISDKAVGLNPMYANNYKAITDFAFYTSDYGVFSGHATLPQVYFRPPNASVAEVADWNTWLAANNLQLVYPLAQPQTYQLTPTEVRTLLGENLVYSDADDVTVNYYVDMKGYIDKRLNTTRMMIAGVETSFVATKNYAIDDFVIVNDTLYRITAVITSGETITPGTNASETTVAEQLIALYNAS